MTETRCASSHQCFGFLLLLLVLMIPMGRAAAFSYDESLVGDIDYPFPFFPFEVGLNTISGHTSVSHDGNLVDRDEFVFSIPTGAYLVDATFTPSSVELYGGWFAEIEYALRQGGSFLAQRDVPFTVGTVRPFESAPLIDSGVYSVEVRGWGFNTDTGKWDADYTWSFQVAEVPEPALFLLFLFGIIAVIWQLRGWTVFTGAADWIGFYNQRRPHQARRWGVHTR